MSDGLIPYPAYKDSGVPWLEQIPAHWCVMRAKNIFARVDIRSKSGSEELLTVSSSDGVVPRREKAVTMFMAESYVGHKLCWPGDLVINSLWAWAKGLGFARHHGIVSSAYGVYRLLSQFREYWYYLDHVLRSDVYQWEFQVRSKGIWVSRLQLTDEAFFDMPVILPAPEDAQSIVRYLDHADRQIRRFIRAKRRTIELLNEQKQAIIHQAVTRGLDPNVPLKPSGIEWLGDVPAHWDVTKIKYLAKVGNGSTPSRGNSGYWTDNGFPWLNSASVNQGKIVTADQFVTSLALRECHLPKVPPQSILIAITGQGKTRGTSALLTFEATINQHMAYIVPSQERLAPSFLHLFLTGSYQQLRSISDDAGSTKGALTCEDVKGFQIVLPSLDEQEKLVKFVQDELISIDTTINATQREIDLIREYRTRLIADVVTGKIDVRAAAQHMPSQIDEAELWDEEPNEEDENLEEVEEASPDDDN